MMNAFIPSTLSKRGKAFAVHSKPSGANSSAEEQRSITIAVSIGGLGWRIARESGFLREELPYRGPMATTFGPESACEATILTGMKPQEHGYFTSFTYAPETSPFRNLWWPSLLPYFLTRRGRVHRRFGRLMRRQVETTRHFEVFNTPLSLLKKLDYTAGRDLFETTRAGECSTLLDDLCSAGVAFRVMGAQRSDEAKFEELQREIAVGDARFVYASLDGLQEVLRAEGTRSSMVTTKLARYEVCLRELAERARERYDKVTVSVFSGHGMLDVRKECALMQIVNSLPLEMGKDYFALYDATMARFWFLNDEAKRQIEDLLECHPDGEWLSDEKLRAWGCDFADRRYGEKLFLMKPGVMLNPSFMGRRRVAAMSGFDPSHEDSTAFFATSEPGLLRPKSLEDVRRVLVSMAGADASSDAESCSARRQA
jgi:hypothetical protein